MLKTRVMATALAVVALALTVTGVVIAATDSNPGDLAKDSLVLNGYPPKTAQLAVTVSTGSDVSVDATVNVNFRTNRIAAVARVPLVITTAAVNLVFANNELYARSADVENGPWFKASVTTPPLFGFSLEFTKPDIDLITGFHKTVTTSGYSTTYVFTRNDVPLSSVFAPAKRLFDPGVSSLVDHGGQRGRSHRQHARRARTPLVDHHHRDGPFVQPARSHQRSRDVQLTVPLDRRAVEHSG